MRLYEITVSINHNYRTTDITTRVLSKNKKDARAKAINAIALYNNCPVSAIQFISSYLIRRT